MKHLRYSALAVAAVLTIATVPTSTQSITRPQKQYTIEQFMNTVAI